MEQLQQTLKPVIDLLPAGVRDYGMMILAGVAILILLLFILVLRTLFRRKPVSPRETDRELQENLASFPPPPREAGNRRVTVYNVPVRLRLVVVAPAGAEGRVDATAVERLLDQVVPALGSVAEQDRPRVRVWPPQISHRGFAANFYRRTLVPESEGQPSRWLLLAGRVQIGKQWVMLGLAMCADEPNTLGRKELEPHQWLDVVRVKAKGD